MLPPTVAAAGRRDRCVTDSSQDPSGDVAGGKRALRFSSESNLWKQTAEVQDALDTTGCCPLGAQLEL